jgi:hypothetical protein
MPLQIGACCKGQQAALFQRECYIFQSSAHRLTSPHPPCLTHTHTHTYTHTLQQCGALGGGLRGLGCMRGAQTGERTMHLPHPQANHTIAKHNATHTHTHIHTHKHIQIPSPYTPAGRCFWGGPTLPQVKGYFSQKVESSTHFPHPQANAHHGKAQHHTST